jgi:hypothetical protein
MKYIKLFENFEKTIQFRDHKGSKVDSLATERDYTESELKSHIDELYAGNTGFVITEYGDEYMVKVEIDGQYYPVGFCDSKFEDDVYNESYKVNEEFETDDISQSLSDWWISCDEQLPENRQLVIIYAPKAHMSKINICRFERGISAKEREELRLSGDENLVARGRAYSGADEHANNRKPYKWDVQGKRVHGSYFGQDVTHWMPIPDSPDSDYRV